MNFKSIAIAIARWLLTGKENWLPKRSAGQEAERRVIKKIGAVPQPASGAFPGMPQDGIKGKFLIQIKSTIKKSISVKREWLDSLTEDSIMRDKIPTLIVRFDDDGTIIAPEDWVAIPLSDFERIAKGWKK